MNRRQFGRSALVASAGLASATLAGATLQAMLPAPTTAQLPSRRRLEWSPTGPRLGRGWSGTSPTDEAHSELGLEHVPRLTLPDRVRAGVPFDVVFQAGASLHPMTPPHSIDWMELSLGQQPVTVVDLSPAVPYPIVRIPLIVSQSEVLIARVRCNTHGVWMTQTNLSVL